MAEIISFSLDKESKGIIEKIEKTIEFKNRSELMRRALQLLLHESEELEAMQGHVDGIVVVTHQEKGEREIAEIKHEFNDIITTQVHNNMHEICMETFIVHGNAETVVSFVKKLKQNKAILYTKIILIK